MSDIKHTPEPWRAEAWHSHAKTTLVAAVDPAEPLTLHGQPIVQYGQTTVGECHGSYRPGGDEANAARIVACVNYCASVPAERLTEDSLEIKLEHIDRLTEERDELANALQLCVNLIGAAGINGSAQTLAAGRAALAKVRP